MSHRCGHVVDRPASVEPGTPEVPGGGVDHVVYMLQGILPFRRLDRLDFFLFFSYDRVHAKREKEIWVSPQTRVDFLEGIGSSLLVYNVFKLSLPIVTESLYSTILQGCILTLEDVVKRSTKRGTIGNFNTFLLLILQTHRRANQYVGIRAQFYRVWKTDSMKLGVCLVQSHGALC